MNTARAIEPTPVTEYSEEQLSAMAELASRRLLDYTLLSNRSYEPNWHHLELIRALEDVERGECKRLMVFMPPRHGKTELVSIRFPAWYMGRHPSSKIIQTSYAGELASDFGRSVRDQINDPLFGLIFTGVGVSAESSAAERWQTTKRGTYIAAGIDGAITGRGANLFIIDDPIKGYREAYSKTTREHVWNWYTTVARTRLQKNAAIIIVQTRWHDDDLAGRLLKRESKKWRVITFPAISETDGPFRKAGKALWDDHFPLADLQDAKETISSIMWNAVYQQKPSKEIGAIFDRKWFARRHGELPMKIEQKIHSWDTAFKEKTINDYSVCALIAKCADGYYVHDVWRKRVEFPELKRMAVALFDRDAPGAVIVEDKASGQSLIQELQRETVLPVIAIPVDADKIARAITVTALFESGRVSFREGATWYADLVEEFTSFPGVANDDQVDAIVQGLIRLKGNTLPGLFAIGTERKPPAERFDRFVNGEETF